MAIPSTESARALARSVVISLHNQDFHNLNPDLSTPLNQYIQNLSPLCHSSLKDSLLFVDRAQTCTNISPAQIEQLIHEHCSLENPFIAPPPPSVLACSSWDDASVFLRRNQNGPQLTLALIPIGRVSPLDIWGVALLAENQNKGVSLQMTKVWKYDRLMIINERDLISLEKWDVLDSCHNQGFDIQLSPQKEKPLCFDIPTHSNLPQQQQQQQSTDLEECLDSDDDYWGQYGDFEDTALKETTPIHEPQEYSVLSGKNLAILTDDEDDGYWCKYSEVQEERKDKSIQHSPSITTYYSPSDDVGTLDSQQAESATGRVLATLDGVDIAPPAPAPNLGEVDSAMLSELLEKLITCGINGEDGFNRKSCFQYSDNSHSDYEDIDGEINNHESVLAVTIVIDRYD
ncbi:hypothetical protein BGZ76_011554 [Entomortierella beljakovae]|nr:hypothetical protein BGZ76_011554 [Entomortierella beljakovae]